jgi:glucosyl-3-phosphoglycerate synthase
MADFHQDKIITTLHALYEAVDRESYLVNLERRLEEHAKHWNICLLLPSLFSELQNPEVLDRIIEGIKQVRYLRRVVVAPGAAPDEAQFHQAKNYFWQLREEGRDVKVLWLDGPRIQSILQEIQER